VFLFSDPSVYGLGYIPKDKLVARWHDTEETGNKYYQPGVSVYGKRPNFNLRMI
jgi:hypothetical protein